MDGDGKISVHDLRLNMISQGDEVDKGTIEYYLKWD
jgi:hypothetical protein